MANLLITLRSVQVLHQHVWGGLGGLSQNADTADAMKGGGGLGDLKYRAGIAVKYLKLSIN